MPFLDELGWSALGGGGALLIGALALIVLGAARRETASAGPGGRRGTGSRLIHKSTADIRGPSSDGPSVCAQSPAAPMNSMKAVT